MSRIKKLQNDRATTLARMKAISAAAADRDLTAEESTEFDTLDGRIGAIDKDLEREARMQEAERNAPAPEPDRREPPVAADVKNRQEDDPRRGFSSPREFLLATMTNAKFRDRSQVEDERLRPLAVADKEDRSAGGELAFVLPAAFTPQSLRADAGSDEQGGYQDRRGGFLVPTGTVPGLLQLGAEADPSAGLTQPVPMTAPMVEINARTDKDHTTSVSGGLVVTRKAETAAASSSRMDTEKITLKAASLFGLAYASEEILTDSPVSFAALISAGFSAQFAHHMLNEKIRGKGADEYLGVLNSPALVTVAKEAGQAADTILAQNVINMRARSWGYGSAIWIANHDTYPQLIKAALVVEGTNAGGLVNVYQPSLQSDRPDMLLGRPIYYSEYPSKLGDVGDLLLVNWSQFLEGLYQPLQSAESVHVRFVNHERAFKFWLRNAGAGWWRSALTPFKGANSLSPFVTLAERA
jgi:HK97 family phage major capsid protein